MSKVYVDADGTLFDNWLDDVFSELYRIFGLKLALELYSGVRCDNLELNIALWLRLIALKEEGHIIILWTNRGEHQIEMTLENLDNWGILHMFDGYIFADGNKSKYHCPDGIVFDNDFRNEVLCQEFHYIPTFRA